MITWVFEMFRSLFVTRKRRVGRVLILILLLMVDELIAIWLPLEGPSHLHFTVVCSLNYADNIANACVIFFFG